MVCGCGREIPIKAMWQALARKVLLRCELCCEETTAAEIVEAAERSTHTLAVVTIFYQLAQYGWASYDSAANAMGEADPAILGGLLPGLQRAGLIERAPVAPSAARVAAFIAVSKPRPTFVPGPLFPRAPRVRE